MLFLCNALCSLCSRINKTRAAAGTPQYGESTFYAMYGTWVIPNLVIFRNEQATNPSILRCLEHMPILQSSSCGRMVCMMLRHSSEIVWMFIIYDTI
jgi:hypothetical protein